MRFLRAGSRALVLRSAVLPAVLCAACTAVAQDHLNVEILSLFDPQGGSGGRAYMDVWGYDAPDGTELAILCSWDATIFVDVTDPTRPETVLQAPAAASTQRVARTYEHYAYVVNDYGGGGMEIYDLSNPRQPEYVAGYDSTFDMGHNIGIYDGWAYIVGSRKNMADAGMRILDLSDPERPREVGAYAGRYAHDVFVRDDVAYLPNIYSGGLTILDVSDKSNPREIVFVRTGAGTHNAWLTEDSRYLLTTHEVVGGSVRIWDVADFQHIVLVGAWGAGLDATVHNVVVKGDSAYASYYMQGLQVVDISDPESPEGVAWYDTRPTTSSGLQGVWGVYPFAASRYVFFSDMVEGLYVARLTNASTPVLLHAFTAAWEPGRGVVLAWEIASEPGDTGSVVILRAPATSPESWVELGRTSLGESRFLDADAQPGARNVYALAVDDGHDLRILGTRHVDLTAPGVIRVLGNQPNPFNPYTRIRFQLARPGHVRFGIFDGRGRLVRALLTPHLRAGPHGVDWDGRDARGHPQPSGTYFYRLLSAGQHASGRMTLLR